MLAKRQQGAPFRLQIRRKGFPLGSAHGTEKNRIGSFTDLQGTFRQRILKMIIGDSADIGPFFFCGEPELGSDSVQNANRFVHDFRTDSVAGKHGNFIIFTHKQPLD